jgi:hypothetical protein
VYLGVTTNLTGFETGFRARQYVNVVYYQSFLLPIGILYPDKYIWLSNLSGFIGNSDEVSKDSPPKGGFPGDKLHYYAESNFKPLFNIAQILIS